MHAAKQQSGVVLILVLVFMLVLSIAAVAAMQLATMEQQLSGQLSERNRSLQWTEAALTNIVDDLRLADFEINAAGQLCETDSNHCYSSQCPQGRCFDGSYNAAVDANDVDDCILSARSAQDEWFQDPSRWLSSGQNQQSALEFSAADDSVPVYGLIEWRCYIPIDNTDPNANNDHQFQSSHWQPLFRITAYTLGRGEQARVMTQVLYSPGSGRFGWREIPLLFAP
ncbi:PilX N-terminal domain-containing pilus assembly protein [Saccharospirillum sp. HFRX-1]|uniref:pilus assembly PilX family protein n=1 Tax=unclassified Saccharospirillum TaxID=2633430 RepID=UPI00371BFAAD